MCENSLTLPLVKTIRNTFGKLRTTADIVLREMMRAWAVMLEETPAGISHQVKVSIHLYSKSKDTKHHSEPITAVFKTCIFSGRGMGGTASFLSVTKFVCNMFCIQKIITDITSESLVSEQGFQFLRDNAQEEGKLSAFPYLNHFYVQEMLMCYWSTHSYHRTGPVSCKQRSLFPSFMTTFKIPSNSNIFMILLPASAAQ